MALVLAGDVGGTKTRLAVYDDHLGPVAHSVYISKHYRTFEAVLRDFVKKNAGPFRSACFGVAGPVISGTVRTTNLDWTIDGRKLARTLRCPVALLNDVEAAAHGLSHTLPKDVQVLSKAHPAHHPATKALVAPGTGLGEAIIHWNNGHYDTLATEGGHADFAPRTALQWELKKFLAATAGDTSVEALLSGRGMHRIYDFLKHAQFAEQNDAVREAIRKHGSPAITEAALHKADPLSIGTLDLFVDIIAAEAQRVALTAKALGGVYLTGGIVPHLLPALKNPRFMRIFLDNRMKRLLERIPVVVVMNEDLALYGALVYARRL